MGELPEHQPQPVKDVALQLDADQWQDITWREGSHHTLCSRFARVRVQAAHRGHPQSQLRDPEWLLIEWPSGHKEPTKYWLSTLPQQMSLQRMVYEVKMRWRIERDYQNLKQELGLGHDEGRGWRGFYHHASLSVQTPQKKYPARHLPYPAPTNLGVALHMRRHVACARFPTTQVRFAAVAASGNGQLKSLFEHIAVIANC